MYEKTLKDVEFSSGDNACKYTHLANMRHLFFLHFAVQVLTTSERNETFSTPLPLEERVSTISPSPPQRRYLSICLSLAAPPQQLF